MKKIENNTFKKLEEFSLWWWWCSVCAYNKHSVSGNMVDVVIFKITRRSGQPKEEERSVSKKTNRC